MCQDSSALFTACFYLTTGRVYEQSVTDSSIPGQKGKRGTSVLRDCERHTIRGPWRSGACCSMAAPLWTTQLLSPAHTDRLDHQDHKVGSPQCHGALRGRPARPGGEGACVCPGTAPENPAQDGDSKATPVHSSIPTVQHIEPRALKGFSRAATLLSAHESPRLPTSPAAHWLCTRPGR